MNIALAIHTGQLPIGGSVWKIMRDLRGVPQEIKEWVLDRVDGKENHCLYFNNAGDTQFAYAHHYNDDWYMTEKEAFNAAWDSLISYVLLNRKQAEELESIQHVMRESILLPKNPQISN